jgi:hypothetical protein
MQSCFRALIALALSSFVLFGQGTTSRLIGTVTDASGSPVPGVVVRLTNEGTGQSFNTSTGENGAYFFEAIQVGNYSVAVEASGFKKFLAKGNVVNIGQPTTVNIKVEVGTLAESIEVSGAYEQVQTSSSGNIGNVFTEKVIQELPIVGTRGRNPLELVLRQPGVVSGANTGGGVHINGARDRAVNYTIDGIDSNETSAGGSNFSPTRTNPDGLAEFKVLTSNATAEFGRNSGAQVSMVTKSGSNEFHGTGFYFYRSPRFNANEWENNINALGKRQFVQNIYGGSIGGPIKKNKLFFFGNMQRLAARESAVVNRTVFTQQARQGLFRFVNGGRNQPTGVPGASVDASGNVVPGLNIGTYNIFTSDPDRLGADPRVKGLVDQTPLPNNFFGGDGLNTAFYTFTALQFERQQDNVLKFDYILNDKNTIFARISWGYQNTLCDRVNGGQPFFPGGECPVNTKRDPQNYAFNWRTNPTSRITNEMVFGRNYFSFDFANPLQNPSEINLTGAPVTIPQDFGVGNARKLNTWQFVDNFSYFAGSHSLKFGLNFRIATHNDVRGSIGGENITASANFSRITNSVNPAAFGLPAAIQQANDRPNLESSINYLLGRIGSIGRGFSSTAAGDRFVAEPYDYKALFNEYDFFLQDTWKVSRRLTVDLGLRLELKPTPGSDPAGRIRRPDQNLVAGAPPTTVAKWEIGKLYRSDRNNWAPSVGIAYDPLGKGKTAIRANYRIAYDRLNTFVLSSSVFQNLPGQVQGVRTEAFGQAGGRLRNLQNIAPPNVNPLTLAQPAAYGAQSITVVDPNFETPTTHMWSFGFQQQVAKNTVVEVNYIGRRAHNLFGAYNANQVDITRNGFLDAYNVAAGGGESPLINRIFDRDPRKSAAVSGSQFMRTQYAADIRGNSVATIAADLSRRLVGGVPIAQSAGLGQHFFIPYPQFANGVNVIDSNDFSTYHGLQMQVDRRMAGGLTAQLSYTWAKSLDTRSFDPAFTVVGTGVGQSASSTPFDINNRRANYAPSDFDRRHTIQSYWIYELPFGKNRRFASNAGRVMQSIVGDWQVAGLMTISSGRPFTVYSGFNSFSNVVGATADCNNCDGAGTLNQRADGLKWYFSPEEVAAFTNPAAGSNGSSNRNRFFGPGSFNMDASFLKRVGLTERFKMEIRADMTNLTNTPTFGFPTANLAATTFGRIRDTVISGSRKIQLGAKIIF